MAFRVHCGAGRDRLTVSSSATLQRRAVASAPAAASGSPARAQPSRCRPPAFGPELDSALTTLTSSRRRRRCRRPARRRRRRADAARHAGAVGAAGHGVDDQDADEHRPALERRRPTTSASRATAIYRNGTLRRLRRPRPATRSPASPCGTSYTIALSARRRRRQRVQPRRGDRHHVDVGLARRRPRRPTPTATPTRPDGHADPDASDPDGDTQPARPHRDADEQPPDTQAPSVPQGMEWTTKTQTSIGLTLGPRRRDNVGVTGYRIYRNGTLRRHADRDDLHRQRPAAAARATRSR